MSLPNFNRAGDLPEGLYKVTLDEVIARFGAGTAQRRAVTERLRRVYELANRTGKLQRFIIFGSYVTSKPEPNDVDVILIMRDDFRLEVCAPESAKLFEHAQADTEFGASIFWLRPSFLLRGTLSEFIAHWQLKRDHTRRGIVEVTI
jgi:hypothetical protein